MAHGAAARPVRKTHFRYQHRLDPVVRAPRHGARRERTRVGAQGFELFRNAGQGRMIEARADIAGVAQHAVVVMDPEQQRADAGARALRIGEAADDEFLAPAAFQFDPVGRAARDIAGVAPLADHAFEADLAGGDDQFIRPGAEFGREPHLVGFGLLEHLFEHRAAVDQRHLAQVVAVEVRNIEQEVIDVDGAVAVECRLQQAEIGLAGVVVHDDFAVVPAVGQRHAFQLFLQRRELVGPVVRIACDETHRALLDAREHAVAVELDFEQPVFGVGRRRIDERGQFRREFRRERRRGVLRRRALCRRLLCCRFFGGCFFGGCLLCRCRLRFLAQRLDLLRRPLRHRQCLHAVGQFVDQREFGGRTRVIVFLLDQQPWRLLFATALHPHERPAAMHLVPVQRELDAALGKACARVFQRLPGTLVPDDHLAGAVLLGRNRAFEVRVRDRVVLDLHGHPLVVRVVAGAFRHGPAFHRAVELEPEIVVQAAGPVLLDHEGEHVLPRLAAVGRLGRDIEIAFGFIGFERVRHGNLREIRSCQRSPAARRGLYGNSR
jgi:hypothetical protein